MCCSWLYPLLFGGCRFILPEGPALGSHKHCHGPELPGGLGNDDRAEALLGQPFHSRIGPLDVIIALAFSSQSLWRGLIRQLWGRRSGQVVRFSLLGITQAVAQTLAPLSRALGGLKSSLSAPSHSGERREGRDRRSSLLGSLWGSGGAWLNMPLFQTCCNRWSLATPCPAAPKVGYWFPSVRL